MPDSPAEFIHSLTVLKPKSTRCTPYPAANVPVGTYEDIISTAGDKAPKYHSGVLPGLDNFIAAGMWTLPPGGLPGAAAAGRFAAHRICIENEIEFKTK